VDVPEHPDATGTPSRRRSSDDSSVVRNRNDPEVGAVGPDLIRDLDTLGAHDGQVAPAPLRAAVQVDDRPS
jgi:hypothetical protein